jgi:hypothetical protein
MQETQSTATDPKREDVEVSASISRRIQKLGLPEPSVFITRVGTVVVDCRNDDVFGSFEFIDGVGATYRKINDEDKGQILDIDPYDMTDEELETVFNK